MKRLLIVVCLVLAVAASPSLAGRPRYIYLMQHNQDKVIVLDGEQARVAATIQAKLGVFNMPIGADDGQGKLLIYSRMKESGAQWVSVADPAGGQPTKQIDLGIIPDGLAKKNAQWILTSGSAIFFGNKGGEGTVFTADLRTGEFITVKTGAKISDATTGANGHLYLGTGKISKFEIDEYTLPDLSLQKRVPLPYYPEAIFRQGQDLLIMEATTDLLALAAKVALATQSVFVFSKDQKFTLHRYNLDMAEIAVPEKLGRAAWFYHPTREILMVAAMNYAGPHTQSKLFNSVMLIYAPGGRCEVITQVFFELFALDPSLNYLYLGGLEGKRQTIMEINLTDFSRRSAEQKGFGVVINDKPYIQGFRANYGGGGGITYYKNPSKVAVLDFTSGQSRDFECDSGAGFGASLGYWLLLREETAVVYLPGRSQVVAHNNKAQKFNIFGFPGGGLNGTIPFKAKDVFLIDAGDGRNVIVRTPGRWQVMDLNSSSLQPFLEEDGGRNEDLVYMLHEQDQKTIYVLRNEAGYIIDPADLAAPFRIPLTGVKYDKDAVLSIGPVSTL